MKEVVFRQSELETKLRWSSPRLERKEVKVITNGSTCVGCDEGAAGVGWNPPTTPEAQCNRVPPPNTCVPQN